MCGSNNIFVDLRAVSNAYIAGKTQIIKFICIEIKRYIQFYQRYLAHMPPNPFTFKIVIRVSDDAIDLGQEKIVRHNIRSVIEVESNQFW